jgi:hypothetical protein
MERRRAEGSFCPSYDRRATKRGPHIDYQAPSAGKLSESQELPKFYGLDETTWLDLDGVRVADVFEGGHAREDKVSAVQYVRFPLGDKAPLFSAAKEVRVVIDHPHYRATEMLSAVVRRSLAEDLREAEP